MNQCERYIRQIIDLHRILNCEVSVSSMGGLSQRCNLPENQGYIYQNEFIIL